jgi:glycosyltransferase involved in cell wall biosynthesis
MKISVVIITYNEGVNIARCLEAAQKVADEIIIVDSFSKDKTKTICEAYNVRFFERKFDGYGEQKNWGNAHATGDFILSLDADEVLSKQLIQDILKQKENPTHQAFRLNRLTNFSGTWVRFAGWYPDKKVRLWHKDAAVWIGKAVHEILEVKDGVKVGQLKGDLLHYSFDSVFDYLKRQNKYAELSVKEQLKHGKTPSFLSSLFKGFYKFFLLYFLKLGFLHGYHGFVICLNGAGKYLINYAKYRQIEHAKTANQSQKGLPKPIQKVGKFSFLNPFKIRFLINYYKKNKIRNLEFSNYNDLKLGGIAAFWVGVPNVVFNSKEKIKINLLSDFLFSTVVNLKT